MIVKPDAEGIARAESILRGGGIVGIPTETVYGLAANAFDPVAVAKVFAAKERPRFDPLIVHLALPLSKHERDLRVLLEESGIADGSKLSAKARGIAARLASAFWPGPLTLVLPRGPKIPDLVTSGLDTVAVRMPRHAAAQALLAKCGFPLAAPSANRFGRLSPTSAEDVMAELGDRIELVLDGGPCEVGLESTIVMVRADGSLALMRPGGVPAEDIARVAGVVPEAIRGRAKIEAPGMLPSHYAPAKPLLLLDAPLHTLTALPPGLPPREKLAVMVISGRSASIRNFRKLAGGSARCEVALSSGGDLAEVARKLFSMLRWLDSRDVDLILVEPPEGSGGLAFAIRDRLERASAK